MLKKTPELPPTSRPPVERPKKQIDEIDVAACSVPELLAFRQQVTAALPARELKDINLSQELVLQILALQSMQAEVINDESIPANQKAQVANSLSAALTTLVKVQDEVFSSERFKRIERAFIETIESLPDEHKRRAFDLYSKLLGTP